VDVAGDEPSSISHQRGEVRSLAPRRGAGIDDRIPRRWSERQRHEHGGLILHQAQALVDQGQALREGAVHPHRVRNQSRLGGNASFFKRGDQGVSRGAQRVRPEYRWRRARVGFREGCGFIHAPAGSPPGQEPARV
jgi:hypothetical protein